MYIVYILKSLKDGKHYTGSTNDIKRRLKEHNSGKTKSTKSRCPFELIYTEEFEDGDDAKQREKYLKTGKGREEIKQILSDAVPHPPKAGKSDK
ncbi:MAG: GIY-YIG nuclease family protein [Bacteroidota bacterium]|nr:GIY-YIG nuclease family protein [Bacteroidota bacterium]